MINVKKACATACNALTRPLVKPANPTSPSLRTANVNAVQIINGRILATATHHVYAMDILAPTTIHAFPAISGSLAAGHVASQKVKQMQNLKFLLLLVQRIRQRHIFSAISVSPASISTTIK